jgi:exodeoxyribonuclease V gamma subunit
MPLNIYTGNRMECLVETLACVVKEPLASPFTPEYIIVQSKGMQRWLAMELAKRFGVWGNCEYPFPNDMIRLLFSSALPEIPDSPSFSPEVMIWRVMDLLPRFIDRKEFAPLQNYLTGDNDGLKRFQLAGKIADTFDQYTLFRPGMLLEWEAGKDEDWQNILWRELASQGSGLHRGRLKEEFCSRIGSGSYGGCGLPDRISVFGISYLPAYHMEVLAAAARTTEVNLFLLSPTSEYWGDIASAREKAHMSTGQRALRIEGNPLLASLGKLGRDFSDMVIEIGDFAANQEDRYEDPGGATLLRAMQSDILNLRGDDPGADPRQIDRDNSVQIQSCHSPMREIEVLHDNLLAILEKHEGLAPRDIVVMTPDIETYAPYVSAVFDGCRKSSCKIPYSIADRRLTNEGQIASVVLKLLNLPGSRFAVTRVIDILEAASVSRRFDLDKDEIGKIRSWLAETRVCWGMDEEDRVRQGLPGFRENSWQAGIDRLLLGYAMPEEGGHLFNGMLPYDDIEGTDARTLGKFVEYIRKIAAVANMFDRPLTLPQWRDELRAMVRDFVAADDDSAREFTAVSGVLENLGELSTQSGFAGVIELSVMRSWLTSRLDKEEKGLGFMTGGVTFCAMLPMRSIPFRVVALIGMNDAAFPRQSRPPGFDHISRNPCRGDRSLRDEDRYLFLESILSARDCLYISYVGQSIKDNSEIPPSVLVSEFIDAIGKGFALDEQALKRCLITQHRLQAFSSEYFSDSSPLFSFSDENCIALLDKHTKPWFPADFISPPLAQPSDDWKDVPLARLICFFANPAKFLLENRLGIRLDAAAVPLEEREPFAVNGLDAYNLHREILEIMLLGGDLDEFLTVARCRGLLPPALHGEAVLAGVVAGVTGFADDLRGIISGETPLEPLDFELEMGEFRLTGRLEHVLPDRMIRYRCAKLKAKDQVGAWLEHLVLNGINREGYPRETLLMMVGGSKTFRPVENAKDILRTILECYWLGLSVPLRFFPSSAMAYAHKQEWRLDKARNTWADGYNDMPGEGNDPYYRICFSQADPFNNEFERIARTLLEPLLQHQA